MADAPSPTERQVLASPNPEAFIEPFRQSAVDKFFEETTPPASLEADEARMAAFVAKHVAAGRRIACVTSGGTTVPLEKNTVRFLDNFSAGTRGATSTEEFLDAGYAVIFANRQYSLQPYTRHYSAASNSFLDHVTEREDGTLALDADPDQRAFLSGLLAKNKRAVDEELILKVEFVSVHDYLFLLRSICQALAPAGPSALLYLAAAVSDFFIPASAMAEHKIQSSDGPLTLQLDRVPKMLGLCGEEWAPEAFLCSFKLETDEEMLLKKARGSIAKYHVDLVVANMLQTRKEIVRLVDSDGVTDVLVGDHAWIEKPLIAAIADAHTVFITGGAGPADA